MLKFVDWCANEHIEKVERIQLSTNDLWQLSESGWEPGDINNDVNTGSDDHTGILVYDTIGILLPEENDVAVYMGFINLQRKWKAMDSPYQTFIRTGYLPRNSKLAKNTKIPTQVKLQCKSIYYEDGIRGLEVTVIGIPLNLTTEDIKNDNIDPKIVATKEIKDSDAFSFYSWGWENWKKLNYQLIPPATWDVSVFAASAASASSVSAQHSQYPLRFGIN